MIGGQIFPPKVGWVAGQILAGTVKPVVYDKFCRTQGLLRDYSTRLDKNRLSFPIGDPYITFLEFNYGSHIEPPDGSVSLSIIWVVGWAIVNSYGR